MDYELKELTLKKLKQIQDELLEKSKDSKYMATYRMKYLDNIKQIQETIMVIEEL